MSGLCARTFLSQGVGNADPARYMIMRIIRKIGAFFKTLLSFYHSCRASVNGVFHYKFVIKKSLQSPGSCARTFSTASVGTASVRVM